MNSMFSCTVVYIVYYVNFHIFSDRREVLRGHGSAHHRKEGLEELPDSHS
jgi:hypothetical protein